MCAHPPAASLSRESLSDPLAPISLATPAVTSQEGRGASRGWLARLLDALFAPRVPLLRLDELNGHRLCDLGLHEPGDF